MPVFNGEAVIRRAIDSLLAQSFENFELIISDNASDDSTQEICCEYAKKDKRVVYSRNDRNVGALGNFKKVLQIAQADIFFWASHDDWWDFGFIDSAVKVLEQSPTAVAAMGVVHYLNANGEEFMTHAPPYGLEKETAVERAYAYFGQGLTDNLIYAVYRTGVLRNAPYALSAYPEKLIILHAVLSGPILDAEKMEYFNVVSFKTKKEIASTLCLKHVGFTEEVKVFQGVSRLLFEHLPPLSLAKVFPIFFFKNNWHKYFVKIILKKARLI